MLNKGIRPKPNCLAFSDCTTHPEFRAGSIIALSMTAQADWDAYFTNAHRRLEEKCAELRRKLEEDDDDA